MLYWENGIAFYSTQMAHMILWIPVNQYVYDSAVIAAVPGGIELGHIQKLIGLEQKMIKHTNPPICFAWHFLSMSEAMWSPRELCRLDRPWQDWGCMASRYLYWIVLQCANVAYG